jgi:hypothetical protein
VCRKGDDQSSTPRNAGRTSIAVHVVTADRGGLLAALQTSCWRDARICHWNALPKPSLVGAADLIVVDLLNSHFQVEAAAVAALSATNSLIAISGAGVVDAAWLSLAAHGGIRIIRCNATSADSGFAPAVALVKGHLTGPAPSELCAAIMTRNPDLLRASDLIAAVCQDPWGIRRPVDLALAMVCSKASLHRRCEMLGFVRVEHLITSVRLLAYECLVNDFGRSKAVAHKLVGVNDLSNLRRQKLRANRARLAGTLGCGAAI